MSAFSIICILVAVLSQSVLSAEFTYFNTTTVGNTRYADSDQIGWPYNSFQSIANVPGTKISNENMIRNYF